MKKLFKRLLGYDKSPKDLPKFFRGIDDVRTEESISPALGEKSVEKFEGLWLDVRLPSERGRCGAIDCANAEGIIDGPWAVSGKGEREDVQFGEYEIVKYLDDRRYVLKGIDNSECIFLMGSPHTALVDRTLVIGVNSFIRLVEIIGKEPERLMPRAHVLVRQTDAINYNLLKGPLWTRAGEGDVPSTPKRWESVRKIERTESVYKYAYRDETFQKWQAMEQSFAKELSAYDQNVRFADDAKPDEFEDDIEN